MATIMIDRSDDDKSPPKPTPEPPIIDPDETARYQIQTIIEFIQVKPRSDLAPGAEEALNWAISSACAAARRIFTGMAATKAGGADA